MQMEKCSSAVQSLLKIAGINLRRACSKSIATSNLKSANIYQFSVRVQYVLTVRFYIILHDKLDIPAPQRADKASFMKVASIYNSYRHSRFSFYNGVLY